MSLSIAVIISTLLFTLYGHECPATPRFPTNYQQVEVLIPAFGFAELLGYETPLTVRQVNAAGMLQWNCFATYHPNGLALPTNQRPILSDNIPSDLYSDNNRLLCYVYSFVMLLQYSLFGEYSMRYAGLLENIWGLQPLDEIIQMHTAVEACGD